MKWTKVEELEPVDGEVVDVITTFSDYNLINGRWTDVEYRDGSWYSVCLPNIKIRGVTHWMYPPESPK
jgi:hypothetical protein